MQTLHVQTQVLHVSAVMFTCRLSCTNANFYKDQSRTDLERGDPESSEMKNLSLEEYVQRELIQRDYLIELMIRVYKMLKQNCVNLQWSKFWVEDGLNLRFLTLFNLKNSTYQLIEMCIRRGLTLESLKFRLEF